MKTWQSYLRDAVIVALDEGTARLEDAGETVIHRLAKEWRGLNKNQKHELIEITVAVGGAISLAAAAFREDGSKKKAKKAKKVAKKAGKKVLQKVVAKTAGVDLKKVKKK